MLKSSTILWTPGIVAPLAWNSAEERMGASVTSGEFATRKCLAPRSANCPSPEMIAFTLSVMTCAEDAVPASASALARKMSLPPNVTEATSSGEKLPPPCSNCCTCPAKVSSGDKPPVGLTGL